jgi:hypothetical protein
VDAFGYLSVLLSIVLGLGLTQVLTGLGRMVRQRGGYRGWWPLPLWGGVLVLVYVQAWWSSFGLRDQADWTFGAFFVVLLQSILLYLMAAVLLPEDLRAEGGDLRAHYARQAPWFFGLLLLALATSLAKDLVLSGRLPGGVNLAFHGAFAVACVLGMALRSARVHAALAVAWALAMGAYCAALFWRLA